MLRRTKGGRDSNREPFPIPADVYAKISAERVRPPLAPTLWRVETANDPSLLAIAHAIATAFIDATKGSTSSEPDQSAFLRWAKTYSCA